MKLWYIALLVFLINLPFGYWRGNVQKFSTEWFMAVHIPVPLIIALRVLSGLGWEFKSFPVLIGSFFLGQLLGSGVLRWWKRWARAEVSSCIVVNTAREIRHRIAS